MKYPRHVYTRDAYPDPSTVSSWVRSCPLVKGHLRNITRPRLEAVHIRPTRFTESQGEILAVHGGDESDMTHSQPLEYDTL